MVRAKIVYIAIVIQMALASSVDAVSADVQGIISRHESGRSKLRSFHLKAEAYGPRTLTVVDRLNFFSNESARKLELLFKVEWIVDGDNERILFAPSIPTKHPYNGFPSNILEIAIKDNKLYCLENWDRRDPQPISPSEQGSVSAQIVLSTSDFRWRDPAYFTLFRPRFNTPEPRSEILDFMGRFSSKTILADVDSHCTVRLQGDSRDYIKSNEHVEIDFSKAHNYLVSRFSLVRDTVKNGGKPGDDWSAMQHVVKQFSDCGEGVFIPNEIEHTIYDAASGLGVVSSLWKNTEIKSVNEAIASDHFTLIFPKDCVVKDAVSEKGVLKWILWGDRNEPLKRVRDKTELIELDKNPVSRRSTLSTFWISINVVILLFGCGFAWKLFKSRK